MTLHSPQRLRHPAAPQRHQHWTLSVRLVWVSCAGGATVAPKMYDHVLIPRAYKGYLKDIVSCGSSEEIVVDYLGGP